MRAWTAIACLMACWAATVAAQRTRLEAPALPPLSMTCPHHPDVLESRPGTCPLCRMALVPVRLDSAWMCPIHSVVTESSPGTCRLCRRQLVQVTVSLTWTCRGEAGVEHVDPGPCKDGTPRLAKRTLRPHGNHNPQHGGQFFMAPDNWHHLEGTYPRDRVFRLYLYDDYARALGPRAMKDVRARVVADETFDPATRRTTERKAFPLRASRDGTYLEARLDPGSLPGEVTAKVAFGANTPEYRFDFTFPSLAREPGAPAAPLPARGAPATSGTAAPASRGLAAAPTPPAEAPALDPFAELAPATMPAEMLAQLATRRAQVAALIARGDFGAVWVPAFAAKDLAVALEPRVAALPLDRQRAAGAVLQEVVRTAWLLDSVGDAGNRRDVEAAFAAFAAAVSDTLTTFSEDGR